MNQERPDISFHHISSPFLLTGSLSFLFLVLILMMTQTGFPQLEGWWRVAALSPLALLAMLMVLDGVQRVEIGHDGVGAATWAGILLEKRFPSSRLRAGRQFSLSWSALEAVELRLKRFQSPLRRFAPRGWVLAGSSGGVIRIPLGHSQLRPAVKLFRRHVHPYFLHLPARNWEGWVPTRQALERMLRTIRLDTATPAEFIGRTALGCLLWGHFSRADKLMDLAIGKQPENLELLENSFILTKRLGESQKARPRLEQLMGSRTDPMDLVEMAELRHAEGDEKGATECLLQAAERKEDSELAHFLLGCLYAQREGLQGTALDQWKKGLERAQHPQLLGKLDRTYRYHHHLITHPEFLAQERRRARKSIWGRRLGMLGIGAVLGGMSLLWSGPSLTLASGRLTLFLIALGAFMMIFAIILRRPGNP